MPLVEVLGHLHCQNYHPSSYVPRNSYGDLQIESSSIPAQLRKAVVTFSYTFSVHLSSNSPQNFFFLGYPQVISESRSYFYRYPYWICYPQPSIVLWSVISANFKFFAMVLMYQVNEQNKKDEHESQIQVARFFAKKKKKTISTMIRYLHPIMQFDSLRTSMSINPRSFLRTSNNPELLKSKESSSTLWLSVRFYTLLGLHISKQITAALSDETV